MTSETRREFIKKTSRDVTALGLSLAAPQWLFPDKKELNIGYLPITDAAPLLIAHAKGYFREEGLTVAQPLRVRTWSTLAESFMSHKFNLTHMLLPMPVWMRYNSNLPVKILAWNHTNGSAITVRGDSHIRNFADLEKKQLAVPYWYSMHNIILQMGLRKSGLQPVIRSRKEDLKAKETNLFILPPSEMPTALLGRKIDGYIVAEPFNALGEIQVGARIMRFTGDIWKNHPCCVVVMHEPLIRENPVFTQKVINSIVRAQYWMNGHPTETARILSREGGNYLPIPENVLMRVLTEYNPANYSGADRPHAIRHPDWKSRRIGFQPFPYPSATRFIVSEMSHTLMEGNTAFLKRLDLQKVEKDLVEATFVKKAIESIGGPSRFDIINYNHPWDREEIIDL